MGKHLKKPLNEQIDICKRRLSGHLTKLGKNGKPTNVPRNVNANPTRFFNLLMNLATLEGVKPRSSRGRQSKRRSPSKK